MQMVIRALGWATKLLWIILVVIVITIAYSATQINVAFGEPTTEVTEQTVAISMPINIHNAGLYDITQFNVTTRITDQNGHQIVDDTTLTQKIPRGVDITRMHTITLNITDILTTHSDLLFNDTTFATFQYVAFTYANAIPLSAHANQTMPWGAPLSNLAVRRVTFQPYNTTHSLANVQLYFENHNQYVPVNGATRMEVYDNSHSLMGTGSTSIDTQPNSTYNGQISIFIRNANISPTPAATLTGEVRLFFETATFSYGPVVVPYG